MPNGGKIVERDLKNPICEACGGINCNCILAWNVKLNCWFPVQRTELWFDKLRKLEAV